MDRSPPFHGGSTGSNPVGVTIIAAFAAFFIKINKLNKKLYHSINS
jgi:hypothetical protein